VPFYHPTVSLIYIIVLFVLCCSFILCVTVTTICTACLHRRVLLIHTQDV